MRRRRLVAPASREICSLQQLQAKIDAIDLESVEKFKEQFDALQSTLKEKEFTYAQCAATLKNTEDVVKVSDRTDLS